MAKLYVCICIDAEGPAGYSKFKTWNEIHAQLNIVNSQEFRRKFFEKKPIILNWFLMDWTGWDNQNPYGRDLGFGKIYNNIIKKYKIDKFNDRVYWHYHHPFKDGSWKNGAWNIDWIENSEYERQLSQIIIDRKDFPVFYRSGGTIETNEQSAWLEKYIAFDFSNRSRAPSFMHRLKGMLYYSFNKEISIYKKTMNFFKFIFFQNAYSDPFFDWRKSVSDWSYYHPSRENYQLKGNMKRFVFRCIGINDSSNKADFAEINNAIRKVRQGENVILSVFSHDFYPLIEDMEYFIRNLEKALMENPLVDWEFSNCEDAVFNILNIQKKIPEIKYSLKGNILKIRFKNSFGSHPFVSCKSKEGYFFMKDFFENENKGINIRTYDLSKIKPSKIGIAFVDAQGNKRIKIITI